MKDYLCKCNNCDSILIDKNPQVNSIKFDVPENAKEMVMMGSPFGSIISEKQAMYLSRQNGCDPGLFWACPVCLTDDCLTDNIS